MHANTIAIIGGTGMTRLRDLEILRSETLQTPISFSASFFAARCSSVLTLTLYLGSVMVAVTCLVPIFIQYGRPGSIGSSAIQMIVVSNWSATPGVRWCRQSRRRGSRRPRPRG